jgi:hypothetical protein
VLRLEDFPRGTGPIGADWAEALGNPRRIADTAADVHARTGDPAALAAVVHAVALIPPPGALAGSWLR